MKKKYSLLLFVFATLAAMTLVLPVVHASGQIKIVALGDSLTEGYGVEPEEAYPALIEKALKEDGMNVRVINAGISGSTSASGLSRLKWLAKGKPDIVILALGANDGLRGQSTENMEGNLREIIEFAKSNKCRVLLAGMRVPTNYGAEYSEKFYQTFNKLSKEAEVPLIPFLLDGVGGVKERNIDDGIHPNPAGHKIIAETVLKHLRKML